MIFVKVNDTKIGWLKLIYIFYMLILKSPTRMLPSIFFKYWLNIEVGYPKFYGGEQYFIPINIV